MLEWFDGPPRPILLARLAQQARAAGYAAPESAAFGDAWWGAEHTILGRPPREAAASGWAGGDRVIRLVNRLNVGAP